MPFLFLPANEETMSEIQVSLKGGESLRLPSGMTAGEALQRFISSTDDPLVAARVDGNLVDLSYPLARDCTVEAVGGSSEESLDILRHSTSHVMAQAVQSLYPRQRSPSAGHRERLLTTTLIAPSPSVWKT